MPIPTHIFGKRSFGSWLAPISGKMEDVLDLHHVHKTTHKEASGND